MCIKIQRPNHVVLTCWPGLLFLTSGPRKSKTCTRPASCLHYYCLPRRTTLRAHSYTLYRHRLVVHNAYPQLSSRRRASLLMRRNAGEKKSPGACMGLHTASDQRPATIPACESTAQPRHAHCPALINACEQHLVTSPVRSSPVQGSPGKSRDDTVGMRLGRVGQSVEWEVTCNYLASCLLFFHKKTREKIKRKPEEKFFSRKIK